MMIPLGGLAAQIIVLGAGALIILLTGRLAGRRSEKIHQRRQRRLAVAALLWLLILTPAAGFGIWRILGWAAEVHAASSEKVDVALLPGAIEMGFPAAFLALVVTAIPLSLWAERDEWKGISPWLVFVVLLALPLALAGAMVDWYVVITPDRIRYNPFFSTSERSYGYKQVRAVYRAPRTDTGGNRLPGRYEYRICFADGGAWSTTRHSGAAWETGRRIAHLVAARSKVKVMEVAALREDQPCPLAATRGDAKPPLLATPLNGLGHPGASPPCLRRARAHRRMPSSFLQSRRGLQWLETR